MTDRQYLTMPPLDCQAYRSVLINFQRWLGVEDSWYDHAAVQVSAENQAWGTVWSNPSSGHSPFDLQTDDGVWVNQTLDLSEVAAHKANVRIRWSMGPTDGAWTFGGWNLDDVVVCGNTNTPVLAACSATVGLDPPGQNAIGERLDFAPRHAVAVGVNQGGFGALGRLYMGLDRTNLYLGGDGLTVGSADTAAAIFLSVDALSHDASNLWAFSGAPAGLDLLHNVTFSPPADVAILLGDEYGDGNFPNFNMHQGGYNMGQGVFFLGPASFTPVNGARLAQHLLTNGGFESMALADEDGDGSPAWREYVADTDPTNVLSCFRITGLSTQAAVAFPSSARRYYTLQRASELCAGSWSNVSGQTDQLGSNGVTVLQDAVGGTQAVFRVQVEVVP